MSDDDIYESFQKPTTTGWFQPPAQAAIGSQLPAANKLPGAWGASGGWSSVPPGSKMGLGAAGESRPMTSNRTAGYTAVQGAAFDPANQARTMQMGPAPPLQKREENSPEEQCNELERKVMQLVEESTIAASQGDFSQALEKAKEAGKRERSLCKQRDQLGLSDQINIDLTYSVHFNLAVQYQNNQLYTEALNTYSLIVRNTQYPQSGRLRVNMGNIYAEQKKYYLAIKMYRKALDDVSSSARDLRAKIMRNIGNAFVKMGQYKDAIGSYESIMELEGNDLRTAFNLLLCYYALGDIDKMKRTFSRILLIKVAGTENEDEEPMEEEEASDDPLHQELKERRQIYFRDVVTAAQLIAPMLDKDWRVGFDYVIDQLRHYEIKDGTSRLASELEMCKALNFLKYRKYKDAIDGLKAFEKKDRELRAKAATNLSYLYFLEGDFDSGEKYADLSVEANQFNPKALVNKGNFLYMRGEFEKAKQFYDSAMQIEADNVEALYNYGLSCKQLGSYEEALRVFKRLHSLVESLGEVLYQIADLYDVTGDPLASEWFHRLAGRVPTDPGILARMGMLFAREGDEAQSFHYYLEAYRYYQVNMDVISWLGAYFVKNEVYDKAMQFFERAATIQPQEVKWQLMVASCHRRRGEYPQAKRMYEDIHRRHPENLECLRYLVHLCKDSGLMEEANEWFKRIRKIEAKAEADQQHRPVSGSGVGELGRRSTTPAEDATHTPVTPAGVDRGSATKARHEAQDRDDDDDMQLPGI